MAWKRVAPDVRLVSIKPLDNRPDALVLSPGSYVEGYYLGVKESPKVQNGFVFLQTENGEMLMAINYSGLAWQLKQVPIGTMVRIEYEGKKKNKIGREFHSFVVSMDEERTLGEGARDVLESIAMEVAEKTKEEVDISVLEDSF